MSGRTTPTDAYSRALLLGAVTGLRSMAGMAALAVAAQPGRPHAILAGEGPPWGWLGTRAALVGFGLAASGELVGDKLPFTPGRLMPGPLGGRLAFGALAGAVGCRAAGVSPAIGGLLGAVGALSGSLGGYLYRTSLAKLIGAPDLPLALIEDAVAHGVARAVAKN